MKINIFQYKLIGQNWFNYFIRLFSTDSNMLAQKHSWRPLTNTIVYINYEIDCLSAFTRCCYPLTVRRSTHEILTPPFHEFVTHTQFTIILYSPVSWVISCDTVGIETRGIRSLYIFMYTGDWIPRLRT